MKVGGLLGRVLGGLQTVIGGLKRVVGGLMGSPVSYGAREGFVCVACHSSYDRQHYQCPQCGEMVLVPLDADATDHPRRRSD